MRIENYDNSTEVVSGGHKDYSIFLAGPTPRSKEVKSWRPEALKIFQSLEFGGTLYYPEFHGPINIAEIDIRQDIYEWERKRLYNSDLILMWLPRSEDLPGLTSNIEFGEHVGSMKLFFGHPKDALKCRYMDWMYKEVTKRNSIDTLEGLIKECCRRIKMADIEKKIAQRKK